MTAIVWMCAALAAPGGEAFKEREITWEAAETQVHGTLTLPRGSGPWPALLMIAGSGPTDRNWEGPLLPGDNGSGRLVARELAEEGVATLRYDKRGSGQTVATDLLRWEHYVAEQRAGLALLREHRAVDAQRVGVLGHSEGGAHAIHLVEQGEPVAGLVLLATAGAPLQDLLVRQVADRYVESGVDREAAEAIAAPLDHALDQIVAGESFDPEDAPLAPPLVGLVKTFQDPISRPFVRAFLPWDPVAALQDGEGRARVSTRVLQGDRDLQVGVDDGERLAAVPGVELVVVPDADHVFKHEPRPLSALDAQVALIYNAEDRELAPGLISGISEFVSSW